MDSNTSTINTLQEELSAARTRYSNLCRVMALDVLHNPNVEMYRKIEYSDTYSFEQIYDDILRGEVPEYRSLRGDGLTEKEWLWLAKDLCNSNHSIGLVSCKANTILTDEDTHRDFSNYTLTFKYLFVPKKVNPRPNDVTITMDGNMQLTVSEPLTEFNLTPLYNGLMALGIDVCDHWGQHRKLKGVISDLVRKIDRETALNETKVTEDEKDLF